METLQEQLNRGLELEGMIYPKGYSVTYPRHERYNVYKDNVLVNGNGDYAQTVAYINDHVEQLEY